MVALSLDPSKPQVAPRSDFDEFRKSAYPIHIGSSLTEIDADKAQIAFRSARRHDKVLFDIDSNGGQLKHTSRLLTVIYELLDLGIDVRVLVGDKCFSVAMSVLMFFPAEARYCRPNSSFMIHSIHFGDNEIEMSPQIQRFVKKKNKLFFLNLIPASTRITKESLREVLDSREDVFITASEALELGIVSAIID